MEERYSTLPVRHYFSSHFLTFNIIDATLRSHAWDARGYTHLTIITGAPSGTVLISVTWHSDNRFDYWLYPSKFSMLTFAIPHVNPLTVTWQIIAGSSSGIDIRLIAWYSPNHPIHSLTIW